MFVACPHCRCRSIELTTRSHSTRTAVYERRDDGEVRVAFYLWPFAEPTVEMVLRCVGCDATLTTGELVSALVSPPCPNCGPYDDAFTDEPPACGICGIHTLKCLTDGHDPACPCTTAR